jgi:hypothetical protein
MNKENNLFKKHTCFNVRQSVRAAAHNPFRYAVPVARKAEMCRARNGLKLPHAGAKFSACKKFCSRMQEKYFLHVKKIFPACRKQSAFAGTSAASGKTTPRRSRQISFSAS